MTVSIGATATSLGLVMAPDKCAECGKTFLRGQQMNGVRDNDTDEPLGWFCDACIGNWNARWAAQEGVV